MAFKKLLHCETIRGRCKNARFAGRFCIPLFSVEINRARWKLNAIISTTAEKKFHRAVAKTCQSLFLILDRKGTEKQRTSFRTSDRFLDFEVSFEIAIENYN